MFKILQRLQQSPETNAPYFLTDPVNKFESKVRQGKDLEAVDYLFKPFKAAELLQGVQARLTREQTLTARLNEECTQFENPSGTTLTFRIL